MMNRQIMTWQVPGSRRLETGIVEIPLPPLRSHEILVEVLAVPIHGSFWLASHPDGRHPRYDEFLQDGRFVFGNGGVGRVVRVGDACQGIAPGDIVAVMGHLPCDNDGCIACHSHGRYTECEFGEGKIVGHGKGAPDGTYARYCVLPEVACERCFTAGEQPQMRELLPFMLGFLLADVRNALTQDPGTLSRIRILLIGAGLSGHLAAWVLLHLSPGASIVVVDPLEERLDSLVSIAPQSITPLVLHESLGDDLLVAPTSTLTKARLTAAISDIASELKRSFGERQCDLVFDASSGNSTPLWANPQVLKPGTHCIPFGFGSYNLQLSKECMQISGLRIIMSRGVGSRENRQAAIELIHAGAGMLILDQLLNRSILLDGLDSALAFIKAQHALPQTIYRSPMAYIMPNGQNR